MLQCTKILNLRNQNLFYVDSLPDSSGNTYKPSLNSYGFLCGITVLEKEK